MSKKFLVELQSNSGDWSKSVKDVRGSSDWCMTYAKGGVVKPPGVIGDPAKSRG